MEGEPLEPVEEARILLDARRELYGESDPATLDAMADLARALRDAGSYQEAESVLRASLAAQSRSGLPGDARVTRTEFDLAIVLDRLGEHDAARRLWQGIVDRSDRVNGPDSTLSLKAATNLAISLRKLKRYGDEFPLRVRVLDTTRTQSGPRHPDTGRALVDLAQTQRNLGNHELALGLFTEAVGVLEENGAEPRTVLYQQWAIAAELVALKRNQEASLMFDQVVAGATEHLGPDDPLRKSALRQRRAYRFLGRTPRLGKKSRGQRERGTDAGR